MLTILEELAALLRTNGINTANCRVVMEFASELDAAKADQLLADEFSMTLKAKKDPDGIDIIVGTFDRKAA
jgi:hypothetical protein